MLVAIKIRARKVQNNVTKYERRATETTKQRGQAFVTLNYIRGRDSSVGIATRYGLDGPGIESRWGGGGGFSAPAQIGPGAHPASYTMCAGSFLVGIAVGAWLRPHTPQLTPRLKEE